MLATLYRMPSWHLGTHDTVIIRADCNVPSHNGIILDDTRLKIIVPTLNTLLKTNARIIMITHWGRPTTYDPSLSTKHFISWFAKQNISALYIDSPCSLKNNNTHQFFMCENIRFLDIPTTQQWLSCLQKLGTYFIHDGFSVMHRDDLFNIKLPRLFPRQKRSLGAAAYTEIQRLDDFINHHLQKPALGIFGGSKLETKIDVIIQFATQHLSIVSLLPVLCMPFFKKHDTSDSIEFTKILNAHMIQLSLPTDLLIAHSPTYEPPYISISPLHIKPNQYVVTIGPETEHRIIHHIDTVHTIIINGLSGFLEIPESLEPVHRLLQYIIQLQKPCLIAGGDTYALVQKYNLTHVFPYYSLAGSAALTYCAGEPLPGLLALQ